mmetsp:Transcript_1331/g.1713  ORF Transcript_1331/g.1713 Transcript_1331/m.1713 type:complete len:88 (+) Transcript_1331:86-349(+)
MRSNVGVTSRRGGGGRSLPAFSERDDEDNDDDDDELLTAFLRSIVASPVLERQFVRRVSRVDQNRRIIVIVARFHRNDAMGVTNRSD